MNGFSAIMVPVDLSHLAGLRRALEVAADLARHYKAALHIVAVTSAAPGTVAPTPEAFDDRLHALADEFGASHGLNVEAHTVISHDPAVDLEDKLGESAKELGVDLVVMASHKPGLLEYIFASHAGHFAAHTDLSVFIVR